MPGLDLDGGHPWPRPPAAGHGAPAPGLLALGLRTEAVARVVERMRAGAVEADVLAEAILAATLRADGLRGRPICPAATDMLPRDRE